MFMDNITYLLYACSTQGIPKMLKLLKVNIIQPQPLKTLIIPHFVLLSHLERSNRKNLTFDLDWVHRITQSIQLGEVLGDELDFLFLFGVLVFHLWWGFLILSSLLSLHIDQDLVGIAWKWQMEEWLYFFFVELVQYG